MEVGDMLENLTAVLEAIDENKPKRKDGTGFITRVQLFLEPANGIKVPHSEFSITHELIYDPRAEEQDHIRQEGREQIAKAVEILKSNQLNQ